jgi:hypothetical protein
MSAHRSNGVTGSSVKMLPLPTLETVYALILKASAAQTSISDVCDDTPGAPSGTATLGHLHEALPHDLGHLWHLEAKLNRVLVANLKPCQLRVRCDVAIDLVLVPYHGEPAQNPEEVRRSEAREGTTHFHCYATAYMIYKDQRLTLSLTLVRKSDTMPAILRRLFKRLDVLNLRSHPKITCSFISLLRHRLIQTEQFPAYFRHFCAQF